MAIGFHAHAFSTRRPRKSRIDRDFDCLRQRLCQRLYPETAQVLALYWLKTICGKGYQQTEWKRLDSLLQEAPPGGGVPTAAVTASIAALRGWIEQTRQMGAQRSLFAHPTAGSTRRVGPDTLVPYVFRLLNEWLPVEIARLLVDKPEERSEESGIPMLVTARAIERLLLREHLSRTTLESMLTPALLSPRLVYPADFEILQDVVLFLLGRTDAPPAPAKLPAVLLCVSPDSPFPLAYAEAVGRASLSAGPSGAEELHVPIPPSQAAELLKVDHLRITSAVVTMDGQLWLADRLQRAERDTILYRAAGRLRIDCSGEHARMVLPWHEVRWRWSGPVSFTDRLEMFGREWHISRWEQDGERTSLHLVFVASLPMAAIEAGAHARLRRSHPAAVDMAWAAMERALTASLARHSPEPVEQLRRNELIPLGRALLGLVESATNRRLRKTDAIETRVQGIRYLSADLLPEYGQVPWRVLPEAVRKILLADCAHRPGAALFREVFEGLPESWGTRGPAEWWPAGSLKRLLNGRALRSGTNSPSRAA
jgi:hypothetical protein